MPAVRAHSVVAAVCLLLPQRLVAKQTNQSRLPGTKMNRQHKAASMMAIHIKHMSERWLRSFLWLASVFV